MHDVLEFLRQHPPFDAADDALLRAAVGAVEIEYFPAGAVLREQGAPAGDHAFVIRTGQVELFQDGRMLDLLGPGDMVGLPSMVSRLPAEVGVRATEDLLVYRLPASALLPLLSDPEGLRFMAREVATVAGRAGSTAAEPIGDTLLRAVDVARPAVVLDDRATIRDAVARMGEAKVSGALVRHGGHRLGIVTDHDLRGRVLAAGVPIDAPVTSVMTPDAVCATPDADTETTLLQMLTLGVRHLPVVDAGGEVLGVVEDLDLLGAQASTPLRVRRRIARATHVAELREIATLLPRGFVAAHDSHLPPRRVAATYSVLVEALTRRIVELRLEHLPAPPVPFALLLSGGAGRREMAVSSDLDSALVWWGPDDDPEVRRWMRLFAQQVLGDLAASGLAVDTHGVCAADIRFARSIDAWREAFAGWFAHPDDDTGLVYLSALADARPVWGADRAGDVHAAVLEVREAPDFLRVVGRASLQHRPPTGFVRDLVVEHSGEHRGRLDVKHGGLSPVVDLLRYQGIVAGSTAVETGERLAAARISGLLTDVDARHLDEVHEFLTGLRQQHQVEQLRSGQAPDDHLDPKVLTPWTRRHLREAFRAIAHLQRGVDADLDARAR